MSSDSTNGRGTTGRPVERAFGGASPAGDSRASARRRSRTGSETHHDHGLPGRRGRAFPGAPALEREGGGPAAPVGSDLRHDPTSTAPPQGTPTGTSTGAGEPSVGPLRAGAKPRPWPRVLDPRISRREALVRVWSSVAVFIVCVLFTWHAVVYLQQGRWGKPIAAYTILVTLFILSRFAFSAFYRPPVDAGIEPTIAVIVPAYNEGDAVARTIHSCLSLDYPIAKTEIVVVNDGSTDDTWEHMVAAAAQYPPGVVTCVDLGSNQGKRAAMAEGIRRTSAEILVFVDSDSMPAPEGVRRLVQGFADPRVGAISGITHVRNAHTNALTRMQMARYFVSYQLLKAAESVVGAVACCSGCFSAYRRAALVDVVDGWEHQMFLGVECTHGDDRALTNMLIRNRWLTIYDSSAEAWTDAPESYKKFFKQQLRWKKSWSREGPILLSHVWRSRTRAFPFVLMATVAGLLSPLVLLLNLAQPFVTGEWPTVYLLGLFLLSMAYALFYRAMRNDGLWLYAFVGTYFYVAFCFQLWWAIIRIRDGAWGTRDQSAGPEEPSELPGGTTHPQEAAGPPGESESVAGGERWSTSTVG